jgi:hypothetical protein
MRPSVAQATEQASSHMAPKTKGMALAAQRPRLAMWLAGASGHRSARPASSNCCLMLSVAAIAV